MHNHLPTSFNVLLSMSYSSHTSTSSLKFYTHKYIRFIFQTFLTDVLLSHTVILRLTLIPSSAPENDINTLTYENVVLKVREDNEGENKDTRR